MEPSLSEVIPVAPDEALHFDLGQASFPVTTANSRAQAFFDQGLRWCFAFNQEEGLSCFLRAAELDPGCAMAHWGVAYAAGPFYNYGWADYIPGEAAKVTAFCRAHIDRALTLSGGASARERGLIAALARRIQRAETPSEAEAQLWSDEYADALRKLWQAARGDADIAAMFVEAMMCRTPWRMWNFREARIPEGTDTLEALAVCEEAIAQAAARGVPAHPAILHMHIHLLEMSPNPERAAATADLLSHVAPDAAHLVHMPAHIYVLTGNYARALEQSELAVAPSRRFLAYSGKRRYYTTAVCHDLHMLAYAASWMGRFEPAERAARELAALLTPDVVAHPGRPYTEGTLEAYAALPYHVLVRFGRWQEIIDWPMPADSRLYRTTTATAHYARGVAFAAMGDRGAADDERAMFRAACDRIPPGRRFFNNEARVVLGVGEMMLEGEAAYHRGEHEAGYAFLREAVRRCDALDYSEPWPWSHPPRHALGALLAEQGRYDEAETVYRADLGHDPALPRCLHHPNNIWALHGLAECLRHRGAEEELAKIAPALDRAVALSDGSVSSSCACRKKTARFVLPGM